MLSQNTPEYNAISIKCQNDASWGVLNSAAGCSKKHEASVGFVRLLGMVIQLGRCAAESKRRASRPPIKE